MLPVRRVFVIMNPPQAIGVSRASAVRRRLSPAGIAAGAVVSHPTAELSFDALLAQLAATDPVVQIDPRRLHGGPAIRGTRIPVSLVLHYLAEGRTIRKILADFPALTRQQVLGAVPS